MSKALSLDPGAIRRQGEVHLRPIPVNAYRASIDDEVARFGPEALIRILHDMLLVRAFETMLDRVKRGGEYHGIRYHHPGPAHLAIGQEAAAVGEAFLLGPDDHIYGSHRSHAEIIAKGLSTIAVADEDVLRCIMETYLGGDILQVVERHLPADDVLTRAIQFLLYGLLAEIFGRRTGFNRGMGGSMHAFFPPFGIYPNNAIVGASAGIAAGAALFKKLQTAPSLTPRDVGAGYPLGDARPRSLTPRRGGLAIANIGDGAIGSGPVWEALNFAAMRQFHTLWEEGYRGSLTPRSGGLPIIFCFINNFYAMGGQAVGETGGYDHLSRIGAAFNPENMHAETVDGNNPLAVVDAIRRKREVVESGNGPVLLDIQCYRQSGHSASDANVYRSREEIEAWRAVDPIVEYGERLQVGTALSGRAILDAATVERLAEQADELVADVFRLAVDPEISPRLDLGKDPDAIAKLMFSNTLRDPPSTPSPDLLIPLDDCSRVRQLATVARGFVPASPVARGSVPAAKAITLRDALFEAIAHHLAHDQLLIAYGEENREWGGAFGVYRGLAEMVPYHRLFNTAISEAAIIATAVGYALEGGRALVELMYADFIGRAGDELFNQLAKWQAMSGGVLQLPVVVRVSVGARYGAQHSQEWTALLAQIPGLKIVYPATPYDAKGLMASALSGSDPVIFFESQRLYDTPELFHEGGVPREYYRVDIGEPNVKRPGKHSVRSGSHSVGSGSDLTILTVGATLYRALETADRLAADFGIEAEVIDARSLVPFNYEPILASVKKTGRILLTSDASERGSYLATLAANIQEFAFDDLDAPVTIVGARNWIAPPAEMEKDYWPQPQHLLDAIHTRLLPLPGYTAGTRDNLARRIEAARRGV